MGIRNLKDAFTEWKLFLPAYSLPNLTGFSFRANRGVNCQD